MLHIKSSLLSITCSISIVDITVCLQALTALSSTIRSCAISWSVAIYNVIGSRKTPRKQAIKCVCNNLYSLFQS